MVLDMSLLIKWFGLGSIDREIKAELRLVEEVLDDVSDVDKVIADVKKRKARLRRVLGAGNKGFALHRRVEQKLKPYLSGKKKTKDLARILLLHKLMGDFKEDLLWQELERLWREERGLLGVGGEALRRNLDEQKQIDETLRQIVELEFNETHMHYGMSVDADIYWKYLVKLWKRALKMELPEDQDIIQYFEKYAREGQITKDDLRILKRIMSRYLEGKWHVVKAFVEFEKLLLMLPDSHGTFKAFADKANILNAVQHVANHTEWQRDFWLKCMDRIAVHNLAHNITHIEIRFPTQYAGSTKLFAGIAREVERKHHNRISIRFVEFMCADWDEFIREYHRLPGWAKKYVVGVDVLYVKEAKAIARKVGLPVCVHAGEVWDRKHYPGKSKAERLEIALGEIELALTMPRIHRIGHATILGFDIKKYLKHNPAEASRMIEWQQKLIARVRRKGVHIEANPSSNVKIRGLTYDTHPIKMFTKHNIKFAISTDDRVVFDTNLKKEFYRIARALRWTTAEIEKAAKMQREAKLS
jgi:hypothetical protein